VVGYCQHGKQILVYTKVVDVLDHLNDTASEEVLLYVVMVCGSDYQVTFYLFSCTLHYVYTPYHSGTSRISQKVNVNIDIVKCMGDL
jgi:hypothetical protein